jgi:hypothetical protein
MMREETLFMERRETFAFVMMIMMRGETFLRVRWEIFFMVRWEDFLVKKGET